MPSRTTAKLASLRQPLVFDPGDRWQYGINIEWVGRLNQTSAASRSRTISARRSSGRSA